MDRLPADIRRREKVFDWLAIVCSIIGSAGLILCSIVSINPAHTLKSTQKTMEGRAYQGVN